MKTNNLLVVNSVQTKPMHWRLLLIIIPLWLLNSPIAALAQTSFNQIQFTIITGADDLRSDSSATATIRSPTGNTIQTVTLKAQGQQGWPNNSTKTINASLVTPQTPSQIRDIVITLTSHNAFGEVSDNWNVQGVSVYLSNNGQGQVTFLNRSGNPLKRLTASQPSLTLTP
jgi:hypothetical protein